MRMYQRWCGEKLGTMVCRWHRRVVIEAWFGKRPFRPLAVRECRVMGPELDGGFGRPDTIFVSKNPPQQLELSPNLWWMSPRALGDPYPRTTSAPQVAAPINSCVCQSHQRCDDKAHLVAALFAILTRSRLHEFTQSPVEDPTTPEPVETRKLPRAVPNPRAILLYVGKRGVIHAIEAAKLLGRIVETVIKANTSSYGAPKEHYTVARASHMIPIPNDLFNESPRGLAPPGTPTWRERRTRDNWRNRYER